VVPRARSSSAFSLIDERPEHAVAPTPKPAPKAKAKTAEIKIGSGPGLPPATVPVTVAGAGYRAAVMVRAASAASAGRPVTLTIRERTIAGATVRQWSGAGTLPAASFARLAATASVVATGNMLDVRVSQGAAVAGDAFYADAFSLERTG